MEIQLPPHIEQAILLAFNAGDYERVASQLADAVRTTNPTITGSVLKTLPEDHDIESLTTTAPFDASEKPANELWPENESIEDFLTFVRTHRNESASVVSR